MNNYYQSVVQVREFSPFLQKKTFQTFSNNTRAIYSTYIFYTYSSYLINFFCIYPSVL